MNRIELILKALKPKVKAFGFNKKELQGIAAKIADDLTSNDDASEEDVNAEIEKNIDAVLPIIAFGQSYANRVINAAKKNEVDDEDDNDDKSTSSKSKSPAGKKSNEIPEWAQAIVDSNAALKAEIAGLKGERVADSRKGKLEKLLANTGTFGTRTLKSFAKMKFDSDEDFDDFYAEVEDDLKALNQERANAGLSNLGVPGTGVGDGKKPKEPEVLSDDDIKALANIKS